jgi:sirohydrochlorin ferrochelatase
MSNTHTPENWADVAGTALAIARSEVEGVVKGDALVYLAAYALGSGEPHAKVYAATVAECAGRNLITTREGLKRMAEAGLLDVSAAIDKGKAIVVYATTNELPLGANTVGPRVEEPDAGVRGEKLDV